MEYGIRSIPAIHFFKDGQLVDQMVGAASKEAFVIDMEDNEKEYKM